MHKGDLVLVTGASGFIGGRLVEKLIRDNGVRVRVIGPHLGHFARVARFGVELRRGELDDPASLGAACRGCAVVFHLAYSGSGSAEGQIRTNREGTRALGEAALAAGVKRFVHMSTVSVYGDMASGVLDETAPRLKATDPYSLAKAGAENAIRELHRSGLSVIVLQPTIVYGPYGGTWTVRPIEQVKSGRVALPLEGKGVCNAVYVDDVAAAAILAACADDRLSGETFLISGAAPVSWEDFYRAYEAMTGRRSVQCLASDAVASEMKRLGDRKPLALALAAAVWRRPHVMRRLLQFAPARWAYRAAGAVLPPVAKARVRRSLDSPFVRRDGDSDAPLILPDPFLFRIYSARTAVSIAKARSRLGYAPAFTFAEGMRRTAMWARWANLLD